jgi:hypothetical protein
MQYCWLNCHNLFLYNSHETTSLDHTFGSDYKFSLSDSTLICLVNALSMSINTWTHIISQRQTNVRGASII